MTVEEIVEIEKGLKACGQYAMCCLCPLHVSDCRLSQSRSLLNYINRLKAETEELNAKLQTRLEKAYEHNIEECNRCMDKVNFKHKMQMDCVKDQIRKETAEEILREMISWNDEKIDTADFVEAMSNEYGVEVDV